MADADDLILDDSAPAQKRAHNSIHPSSVASGGSITASTITTTTTPPITTKTARAYGKQMKLCGNAINPDAPEQMNITIADFIHSNCLSFLLAEDPKFLKVVHVAKSLGAYKPPNCQLIGGKYLDALHQNNWREQMKTLLSEATIFGITIFGDGATIKTILLLNVLAAGVNNLFAPLNIVDCTNHLARGGKKDASHIATVIKPLIANLEGEIEEHKRKCTNAVDLIFFDVASNVQNAGELLQVKYPLITVGHGAEHVVSLFFKDVDEQVSDMHAYVVLFDTNHSSCMMFWCKVLEFRVVSEFAKKCRNIWGSVRHKPSGMFKKYSKQHNNLIPLGFIKSLECRMAGEYIALLRLLCL